MECGSYRASKLLEYALKVIEPVFDISINEKVKVDELQLDVGR